MPSGFPLSSIPEGCEVRISSNPDPDPDPDPNPIPDPNPNPNPNPNPTPTPTPTPHQVLAEARMYYELKRENKKLRF